MSLHDCLGMGLYGWLSTLGVSHARLTSLGIKPPQPSAEDVESFLAWLRAQPAETAGGRDVQEGPKQ